MRVVVVSAGQGSRFNNGKPSPINKGLRCVAGAPILQHILEDLRRLPVSELIMVDRSDGQVEARFGNSYKNLHINHVVQPLPLGIADAVHCALEGRVDAGFLLCLGDEYYSSLRLDSFYAAHLEGGAFATCCAIPNASKALLVGNYEIIADEFGRGIRFREKPVEPEGTIAGTGRIFFSGGARSFLTQHSDLASLLQGAVNAGKMVNIFSYSGLYFNLNSEKDILRASAALGVEDD